jgi:RNA polymerase sigma factor (sigma-70 family)
MEEMRHVRRLSRSEELRLAAALSTGRGARLRLESGDVGESLSRLVEAGRRAEERLAQAHLPLVIAMALSVLRRNWNVGVSLEDLVLAGNEGLLEGLRRYDPSRGYRVSTCAIWWIRNKVSEELRLYRWKIRIPDHAHRQLLRIMRVYRRLSQEFLRDPTDEEVGVEVNMAPETLRSFIACLGGLGTWCLWIAVSERTA